MKILIIQTAFIGDVVLATPIIEKLKSFYPNCTIDFVLRKGNEGLLFNNPNIHQVFIFDKKKNTRTAKGGESMSTFKKINILANKYKNLLNLIKMVRKEKYDYVINVQRFFTTGLLTAFSGAKNKIGFNKNPWSFMFTESVSHNISVSDINNHEVKRNLLLIEKITDSAFVRPVLYPSAQDFEKVKPTLPYICIAPASVWFTKQFPTDKWVELINALPDTFFIYLMGSKTDFELCSYIKNKSNSNKIEILAGQLSFLESAALMKNAVMNYVNDSAPLHFASAMNAPVTAMFCSTIPEFGFGPLSDRSFIMQTNERLTCRPCGLHGKKACPRGHFKCANIDITEYLKGLLQ